MQPWFITLCGIGARGIGITSRLLLIMLLVQYLGVEQYAIFAVMLSLEGWLALTDWGLGSSCQNAVSLIRVTKQDGEILFRSVAQLGILLLLFVLVCAFLLSPSLHKFLFPQLSHSWQDVVSLFVAISAYGILAIGTIGYRVLFARQQGYWVHLWQTVGILSTVGAVSLLLSYPAVQDKMWLAILCGVGPQSLVALCVFLSIFWKHFDFMRWDWKEIKSLFSNGLQFFTFGVGAIIVLGIDYIVMSRHVPAESIVAYHVANRMFIGCFALYSTWLQAVWPVYSELKERKEFGKMKSMIRENCLYGAVFILAITALISVGSPFLCRFFFSHEHVDLPLPLIAVLGGYYFLRVLCDPYATALQSMNYLKPLLIAVFCQAAVSWIGQTLFVQYWGVYGIVFGLMASYLMTVSWVLPSVFYKQMRQGVQTG